VSVATEGHRRTREACAQCGQVVEMLSWQAFCSARCRDRAYRVRLRAAGRVRPSERREPKLRAPLPIAPGQPIRCLSCLRVIGEAVDATIAIIDRGRVVLQCASNGALTLNAECSACGSFTLRELARLPEAALPAGALAATLGRTSPW
jgi:rRNA maturation protein Nop10